MKTFPYIHGLVILINIRNRQLAHAGTMKPVQCNVCPDCPCRSSRYIHFSLFDFFCVPICCWSHKLKKKEEIDHRNRFSRGLDVCSALLVVLRLCRVYKGQQGSFRDDYARRATGGFRSKAQDGGARRGFDATGT